MGRFAVALCALTLASCGGDGEPGQEPTGATGAAGATGASLPDVTVGEFIDEIQPEKQKILEEVVSASDVCDGAEVDPSLVLLVTAKALDAPQDSPVSDIVEEEC